MIDISGIHHVALIVSDYERSKHFYSVILGLPIIDEHFRAERRSFKLDLRAGAGVQIELFSFPAPPARLSSPEACGLRHLAFKVARLDEAIRCLKTHHIVVEPVRVDENTGRRFTFFKDPDDLPLELYEV